METGLGSQGQRTKRTGGGERCAEPLPPSLVARVECPLRPGRLPLDLPKGAIRLKGVPFGRRRAALQPGGRIG